MGPRFTSLTGFYWALLLKKGMAVERGGNGKKEGAKKERKGRGGTKAEREGKGKGDEPLS